MLIGNGQLYNKVPITLLGDRWNAFVRDECVSSRCVGGFGRKSALPSGYGVGRAIWPAITAGGINSHKYAKGEASATITMQSGWNIAGQADGTTPTAEATLQLVVSMQATSDGEATTNANLNASLAAQGSITCTSTDSATIGALAWAYGLSEGSSTATLTSYATGRLYGAITPFTELSPETLAATVLEYAVNAPIHANIQKVNDVTVNGTGAVGDEWGP